MPNITENPDYRLVMTFLQNIRPGDMDQESSEQLMMIGQRIQAGGALTDREREMFEAVVGAMPSYAPANNLGSMSEGERSYEVDGRMESMSPQMMDSMVSSGDITQEGMAPMPMYDQRMPSQDGATRMKPEDEDPDSRLIRMIRSGAYDSTQEGMPRMPSQDGNTYSQSSGVTPANNVMTLEEAVAAGIVAPTARPQARPAPMRPQARPMR